MSRHPRAGRTFVRWGLALGTLLLGLLAAETLARLFPLLDGRPYDAQAVRARLAENLAAARGVEVPGAATTQEGAAGGERAFFLHPFLGWETRPNYEQTEHQLRRVRALDRDRHYLVMVLGGSVAGFFADPEAGAPGELALGLERDPRLAGKRVVVLGQGRGAFKQPQQLNVLTWSLAQGLVPDAVINLDGFNEVALSRQNLSLGAHPLYPSFPQWANRLRAAGLAADSDLADRARDTREGAARHAERALSGSLTRSAFLGTLTARRSEAARETWQELHRELLVATWAPLKDSPLLGPRFEGEGPEAIELAVELWREASQDIAALCARRGIAYLHVLQPTLHDPGAKRVSEDEIRTGGAAFEWIQGVRQGYPRLRAAGEALRAQGFPFWDASRLFAEVEETLYYDACHFNRKGNQILAMAVADAFLGSLAGH